MNVASRKKKKEMTAGVHVYFVKLELAHKSTKIGAGSIRIKRRGAKLRTLLEMRLLSTGKLDDMTCIHLSIQHFFNR